VNHSSPSSPDSSPTSNHPPDDATSAAAQLALDPAGTCHVDTSPLLTQLADTWHLEPNVARSATAGRYGRIPDGHGLLWYRNGPIDTVRRVALQWLTTHDRVTSGDIATLTGMSQSNASTTFTNLATTGQGLTRGEGRGRNATSSPHHDEANLRR
jgi:ATP-dependent DNA helicase RecG